MHHFILRPALFQTVVGSNSQGLQKYDRTIVHVSGRCLGFKAAA